MPRQLFVVFVVLVSLFVAIAANIGCTKRPVVNNYMTSPATSAPTSSTTIVVNLTPVTVTPPAVIVSNTVVVQQAPVTTQTTPTQSVVMVMPSSFTPTGTITNIGNDTVIFAFDLYVESGEIAFEYGEYVKLLSSTRGSASQYELTALTADELGTRWLASRSLFEADLMTRKLIGPRTSALWLVSPMATGRSVTIDASQGPVRRTYVVTADVGNLPTVTENSAFQAQFAVGRLGFFDRVAGERRSVDGQSAQSSWLTFEDGATPAHGILTVTSAVNQPTLILGQSQTILRMTLSAQGEDIEFRSPQRDYMYVRLWTSTPSHVLSNPSATLWIGGLPTTWPIGGGTFDPDPSAYTHYPANYGTSWGCLMPFGGFIRDGSSMEISMSIDTSSMIMPGDMLTVEVTEVRGFGAASRQEMLVHPAGVSNQLPASATLPPTMIAEGFASANTPTRDRLEIGCFRLRNTSSPMRMLEVNELLVQFQPYTELQNAFASGPALCYELNAGSRPLRGTALAPSTASNHGGTCFVVTMQPGLVAGCDIAIQIDASQIPSGTTVRLALLSATVTDVGIGETYEIMLRDWGEDVVVP